MSAGGAFLELAIVALGVARLTVLVTSDRILKESRDRWQRRFGAHSYAGYLSWCPWCIGWWIALASTSAWMFWPAVVAKFMLPWAVAFVASVLASKLAGSDPPPPDVPRPSDIPREDA